MPDLNKVFLMGRLTFDPELRRTPTGTAVTELRLATNRSWAGRDGERREELAHRWEALFGLGGESGRDGGVSEPCRRQRLPRDGPGRGACARYCGLLARLALQTWPASAG